MTKVSEMVERVARALHARFHEDTMDGRSGGAAALAWERLASYDEQEEWLDSARAAIAAMREPTEAMLTAGERRGDEAWGDSTSTIYERMIDAALGEERLETSAVVE